MAKRVIVHVLILAFALMFFGSISAGTDEVGVAPDGDFLNGRTFYVKQWYSSGDQRQFYWEFLNGQFIQTDPDTGDQNFGSYNCKDPDKFFGFYVYSLTESHVFLGKEESAGKIIGVDYPKGSIYLGLFIGNEVDAVTVQGQPYEGTD